VILGQITEKKILTARTETRRSERKIRFYVFVSNACTNTTESTDQIEGLLATV